MGLVERHKLRSLSTRLSRWQKIALGLFISFFVIYITTPYDGSLRSFFRFQHNVIENYYQGQHPSDAWLFRKPRYPIDLNSDVGVIIKTGYGTKQRIPVALKALSNESFFADTLVVQDFPVLPDQKHYTLANGKNVSVVDIIGWNLKRGALKGREHLERIYKYKNLAAAVEDEEWVLSEGMGKAIGWELDAMKFLPALEYAWNTMPKKKWYVMLDDDTYMIKGSLGLLLGHLNFGQPHFLGNPVGDYKGRFPHGGSSVILSGATLRNLFEWHPEVVVEGNLESPMAIWGDKLLSTTLMKIAIYLDESYRRVFNGEHPWMTRMWSDRLCLPLMGFHGLGNPEAMEQVGDTFKDIQGPVFWRSLAQIYGAPDYSTFIEVPIRPNMDYVGRLDEFSTTVENVAKVEDCVDICDRHSTCLAWTFDPSRNRCDYAPWAILGDFADGRFSGVNGKLAQRLVKRCHSL
ncbi:glycosyltransferase family 31 protein [Xylariaceae sp. FL1651]|nr:glycosyltransferase family 31 protein [Xylariaceae sp. FL1651]